MKKHLIYQMSLSVNQQDSCLFSDVTLVLDSFTVWPDHFSVSSYHKWCRNYLPEIIENLQLRNLF
jgi:hypothetical protein